MPPKGKGKKRVQKKGQDLVKDDTREEQESPEGRPELNLVIGDVPQASQIQPSWKNTRENTIDVQLFHPYIYQTFLAKSQRKSHSGGTLHVRRLFLQGTLQVPQACDI